MGLITIANCFFPLIIVVLRERKRIWSSTGAVVTSSGALKQLQSCTRFTDWQRRNKETAGYIASRTSIPRIRFTSAYCDHLFPFYRFTVLNPRKAASWRSLTKHRLQLMMQWEVMLKDATWSLRRWGFCRRLLVTPCVITLCVSFFGQYCLL